MATVSENKVIMTELVMPGMTNPLGNLRGGKLMDWMDIAGALACMKYCHHNVATICSESITFKHPVPVGSLVTIEAKIIFTGTSSMVTKITVVAEDIHSGLSKQTNTALFTFIALHEDGKPIGVPNLIVTDDIQEDFQEELRKYKARVGK